MRTTKWPTEDYCSYKLSKVLNDKGFPGLKTFPKSKKHFEAAGLRKTHNVVIKWIRENFRKDYAINLFPYTYRNKLFYEVRIFGHYFASSQHKTTFDAVEAALLYSLTHLVK
jgi:hypothetical protein